jgi:hypothetical protein
MDHFSHLGDLFANLQHGELLLCQRGTHIVHGIEEFFVTGRPQPSEALWRREAAKLQAAIGVRDKAQKDARAADMKLRKAINAAFKNGLSASYISDATGLTVSRCYQISRGTRT